MADILRMQPSNCQSCYKCIRNCPVKSIRFSGGQAHIMADECIFCGHCFITCPQGAIELVESIKDVKLLLLSGAPVIASIAPSFVGFFNNIGISSIEDGLKKLGFFAAEETAIGATMVKTDYEKMLKNGKKNILISSCCHSVNTLIGKYFPSVLPYLANILSPMQAHCEDIKRRYPDAKTVFIGPCVSKKDEAQKYKGIVDAVITFEELQNWFDDEKIVLEPGKDSSNESKARLFPITGGILKTMGCDQSGYDYIAVDGLQSCIEALRSIEAGSISNCFIEMSACEGSCIGGPIMRRKNVLPLLAHKATVTYAGKEDFKVLPLEDALMQKDMGINSLRHEKPCEEEIKKVLKQMGKTSEKQELNCGCCGYNTCREKAAAVLQGKADLTMCLPYLKNKAENISNIVMDNTPTGIIVLNEELEVQHINTGARGILNIADAEDVLGGNIDRITDVDDILMVKASGENLYNKSVYFTEYKKNINLSIIYDKENHMILYFMRDVTDEETIREQKERLSLKAIEMADNIASKQMKAMEEITALLGETAAETNVVVENLRKVICDE